MHLALAFADLFCSENSSGFIILKKNSYSSSLVEMDEYKLESLSKVNLLLNVGNKSSKTNLHYIESIFARTSLSDKIYLSFGDLDPKESYKYYESSLDNIKIKLGVRFVNELKAQLKYLSKVDQSLDLLLSDSNIILKAIANFFKHSIKLNIEKPKSLSIHLDKSIPFESGLGGASSNAAEILKFLFNYYNIGDKELLYQMSLECGNDVLPCLFKRAVFFNSKNLLELVSDNYELNCIIIKPSFGSPTKKAFELLNRPFENLNAETEIDLDNLKTRYQIKLNEILKYNSSLSNDFFEPLASCLSPLMDFYNKLLLTAPKLVNMTGSGTAMFGVYQNDKALNDAFCFLSSELTADSFIFKGKINI